MGHKLLLQGPSKSGKSFLLIELSICLSEGLDFLGFECRRSKVVYINLEIDRASVIHRFKSIYEAHGIVKPTQNITILNLRGKAKPLDQLVPMLVRQFAGKGYEAIILDPIYKTLNGDENSASDMAQFTNQFDVLCDRLHATIIYAHHHSKGSAGQKAAQDRSSGSGVFARDPDAIMDMIQINPDDCELSVNEGVTAWRTSYTLREFMSPRPKETLFEYPLHKLADGLQNAEEMYGGSPEAKRERGQKSIQKRKEKDIQNMHDFVVNAARSGFGAYTVNNLAEALDKSSKTIERWISDERSGLYVKNGYVFIKPENEDTDKRI